MKNIFLVACFTIAGITVRAQWVEIRNAGTDYLQSLHFITADTGYASGTCNGNIYRTQDGGATWDTAATYYTMDAYTGFAFPSSQTGYACGSNLTFEYHDIALKTANGGAAWDTLKVNGSPDPVNYLSVDFVDENNGVFIGRNSFITHDRGATFNQLGTPVVADPSYFSFNDIKMLMPEHLIAAVQTYLPEDAGTGRSLFQILSTMDGGTTWSERYTDTSLIERLFFLDHNNGWAFTHKNLLHTTDAGNSWTKISLEFLPESYNVQGLQFTDPANGWLVINAWKAESAVWDGHLYHTGDGGNTWSLNFTTDNLPITAISMLPGGTGYLSTGQKIFKTANGGGTGIGTPLIKGEYINVYPNPSKGIIQIENKGGPDIKAILVTDLSGRTTGISGYDNKRIDLGGTAPGIYLLHIFTEKDRVIKKITLH